MGHTNFGTFEFANSICSFNIYNLATPLVSADKQKHFCYPLLTPPRQEARRRLVAIMSGYRSLGNAENRWIPTGGKGENSGYRGMPMFRTAGYPLKAGHRYTPMVSCL